MNVGGWLRSLGLAQYEDAFRDNAIDDSVLPSLTVEDLKDLGVGIVGHLRKLLDAIVALRADEKDPPPHASVEPSANDAAERRQVTVMFSDLVVNDPTETWAGSRSARHRVDHGTICGRNCANSGHYKPLRACVHRIFVNSNSSRRRPEKIRRYRNPHWDAGVREKLAQGMSGRLSAQWPNGLCMQPLRLFEHALVRRYSSLHPGEGKPQQIDLHLRFACGFS
jgi:SAM (Sterile alpha motif) domain-containing protein